MASACEELTHRFGEDKAVTLVEGDSTTCHCGGVTVQLRGGQMRVTATVEAMRKAGAVDVGPYSLSWGGRP